MKQVVLSRGRALVIDVPRPQAMAGSLVVRVACSVVSPGTERANLHSTRESALTKVRRRPELAREALVSVLRDGLGVTLERVRRKRSDYVATGYSCAGTVVEVGSGVPDIAVGQAVACAGAQCAWHAEYVAVPRNLVCPVPDGVVLEDAASVALGAIAIQAVRQAGVELGDLAVVIGLGTVGLLIVQLLRAAGAAVIAVDPLEERRRLAMRVGARAAVEPAAAPRAVGEHSRGLGADRSILAASTPSSEPLALAMDVTRKRGVVVVVGEVGLTVPRSPFYQKEIDLRISCSYGPGRYDAAYEEGGVDYPAAFVRWTENRNMAAYLELLRDGAVDWRSLVETAVAVDEAPRVFEELAGGVSGRAYSLRYPGSSEPGRPPVQPTPAAPAVHVARACVRLGVIGAGNFARAVHFPHLKALRGQFRIVAVASRSGLAATNAARQTRAVARFTDYHELLERPDVDAVLIATRHDLHASIAAAALHAGKAVLLEKPLALDAAGMEEVLAAMRTTRRPLLVGFNRRFSSAYRFLRDRMARHVGPPIVSYRVNADPGGPQDWTHGPEGGGRAVGEACHMVDFLHALAGTVVVDVRVAASRAHGPADANMLVQLCFANGLTAGLLYTTAGAPALGKERIEVYLGGEVAVLEDFRKAWVYGARGRGWPVRVSKGYREEWELFHRVCVSGEPSPMTEEVLRSVTLTTLRIRDLAYATCAESAER